MRSVTWITRPPDDGRRTGCVDARALRATGAPELLRQAQTPKERSRGEIWFDLTEALQRSVAGKAQAESKSEKKSAQKPRKAAVGQKGNAHTYPGQEAG